MKNKTNQKAIEILSEIFQSETGGVIRYLHYSFMIMGHNRIPIQKWFREQANESMAHSILVGEKITSLGGHPPVISAAVKETNEHGVDNLLRESLHYEEETLKMYKKLVKVAGDDIALEEFARQLVQSETEHCDEVKKMLRHD